MADTYKVLGQSNPSATTLTDCYTVPASTSAVVTAIIACNRSSSASTIRVSIAVGGAANSNEQYIAYDITLNGNDSVALNQRNLSLGDGDVVRVYTQFNTVSFSVFGMEIA